MVMLMMILPMMMMMMMMVLLVATMMVRCRKPPTLEFQTEERLLPTSESFFDQ